MAAQATIAIDADTRDAIRNIERMTSKFKRSFVEIDAAISLLGTAFDAATSAIGSFVAIGKEAVDLANIQEAAERKLVSALQLQGAATEGNIKRINAFNSAMQQRLGYGDEELLQLQSTLLAMNVHNSNLEDATRGALALSAVLGGDLSSNARIVAKALGGDVAVLKRYGIVAKDAEDAQKKLNELFAVAEGQAGSAAVKMKVLGANVGDFKEELGFAITKSEGFKMALDISNEAVTSFIELFSGEDGVAIVNDVVQTIAGSMSILIDFIIIATKKYTDFTFAIQAGLSRLGLANSPVRMESLDETGKTAADRLNERLERLSGRLRDLADARNLGGSGRGSSLFGGKRPPPAPDQEALVGVPEALDRKPVDDFSMKSLKQKEDAALVDARVEQFKREQKAYRDHMKEMRDLENNRFAELSAHLEKSAGMVLHGGLADAFVGLGEAIADGSKGLNQIMGQVFGGVLKAMGQLLIQVGSAGILAGTLGTVIPFFKTLTGGELGIAAGAAAVAGGTAMVALGSAMGGTGGTGGTATRTNARTGGAAPRVQTSSSTARLGTPASAGDFVNSSAPKGDTIINVNFGKGMVVGSKREIARFIAESLGDANVVSAKGRGGGF